MNDFGVRKTLHENICEAMLAYLKTLDKSIPFDLLAKEIKLYTNKTGTFKLEFGKRHVMFDKFCCYYGRGMLKDKDAFE